jgi:integrase
MCLYRPDCKYLHYCCRFVKEKALKQNSRGFRSKKSKVLSREDVLRFFSEAPDEIFLLVKIVLVMGIAGGCRVGELVNMKIDDVDDRGNVLVVTPPDTKTNKPVHDNQ